MQLAHTAAAAAQIQPSAGSRLYQDELGTILLGQPPKALKGLLQHGISNFDTLVLQAVKEKSLLHVRY
jgi:hypothetical protein